MFRFRNKYFMTPRRRPLLFERRARTMSIVYRRESKPFSDSAHALNKQFTEEKAIAFKHQASIRYLFWSKTRSTCDTHRDIWLANILKMPFLEGPATHLCMGKMICETTWTRTSLMDLSLLWGLQCDHTWDTRVKHLQDWCVTWNQIPFPLRDI